VAMLFEKIADIFRDIEIIFYYQNAHTLIPLSLVSSQCHI
jgi:hypothetical protein